MEYLVTDVILGKDTFSSLDSHGVALSNTSRLSMSSVITADHSQYRTVYPTDTTFQINYKTTVYVQGVDTRDKRLERVCVCDIGHVRAFVLLNRPNYLS